jgi:hypothetical protein
MPAKKKTKVPVSLRLSPELKKQLLEMAQMEQRSLTNQIQVMLARACAETKGSE